MSTIHGYCSFYFTLQYAMFLLFTPVYSLFQFLEYFLVSVDVIVEQILALVRLLCVTSSFFLVCLPSLDLIVEFLPVVVRHLAMSYASPALLGFNCSSSLTFLQDSSLFNPTTSVYACLCYDMFSLLNTRVRFQFPPLGTQVTNISSVSH